MTTNIVCKNITLDEPLRVFVEEKIGGLSKLIDGSTVEARVEIGKPSEHHRTGPIFYAEVNLSIGGTLLRAEATNYDLRAAIVDAKDEMQIQIKKFKEKRNDLARQPKE